MPVDLDDLLVKTSRTFALAIPLLAEPTRRAVSAAYLLFRIADTLEDASAWSREARLSALSEFAGVLALGHGDAVAPAAALARRWLVAPPVRHAGYLELLERAPEVLAEVERLDVDTRRLIFAHAHRATVGMASFVARADERGGLCLTSLQDLQDYCYVVAGIVGELLTELFLAHTPALARERAALVRHAVPFGEGLQLVNILKDAADDARDGRVYIPAKLSRRAVAHLARADLEEAAEYVLALQRGGAPRGSLAFAGTALVLADASLERLAQQGAGAKVPRAEVLRLLSALEARLDSGEALDLRPSVGLHAQRTMRAQRPDGEAGRRAPR